MSTAALAVYFPGAATPRSYEDFVRLALNVETMRARKVMDTVDAVRIALGSSSVPDHWFELLCRSEEERATWKTEEFRREQYDRR